MALKTILPIIILLSLIGCDAAGIQELQGVNAVEQPVGGKVATSPWAQGMPQELAERTYAILEEVMVPENVVMVMVCVTQDRGDGDVGLACMSVHPGVFAVAAEELRE